MIWTIRRAKIIVKALDGVYKDGCWQNLECFKLSGTFFSCALGVSLVGMVPIKGLNQGCVISSPLISLHSVGLEEFY